MTTTKARGSTCRPALERAATLRAYAAKILEYAEYFEQIRARSESPDRTEQDCRAERIANTEFLSEPGAHAVQQRIEFEAELFEAIEQFRARVRQAERLRRCSTCTLDNPEPLHAQLDQIIGDLVRTKF